MSNQNETNQSIIIEDLTTPDANEIKGGPTTQNKRTVILKSAVAGEEDGDQSATFNHNETVSEDNDVQEAAVEQFVDLAVDEATATELVGGPTSVQWPFYAQTAPGNVLNHNETVIEDSGLQEAVAEPLTDMTVDKDSEAEIKGGRPLYQDVSIPSSHSNHNETVSEDNDAQEAVTLTDLTVDEISEVEIKGGAVAIPPFLDVRRP